MKNRKNTNYSDLIFTTAKITKEVIIEEDIKVLNKVLLNHEETEQVRIAIAHLLNDYTRQKRINEEHKKENGELRAKVKKLEEIITDYQRMYCRTMNDGISKQKIEDTVKRIIEYKIARTTNNGYYYDYFINQDYKEDFIKLFNQLLEDK